MVDWKKPPEEALHHGQADPEFVRQQAEKGREAAEKSATGVAYEKVDISPSAVTRLGLVLVVSILAAVALSFGFFLQLRSRQAEAEPPRPPMAIREVGRVPPEPRLQTTPRSDLRASRARQEELVGAYGWLDREAGTVRIPIEEAMRIYLERRAATGGAEAAGVTGPDATSAGTPSDASAPFAPGGGRR